MAEKRTPGQFREAFKGYNKEDVNAYIQQMFFQFEERERALTRARKEAAAPQPSPEKDAEIEALKAKIAELEALIEAQKAKISEMETAASRYEKMSAQVGDIMLGARSDAERLTEGARESAKQIETDARVAADALLAQANAQAAQIRTEALKQADTIISYAADRMKHLYNAETEGYAKVLETLRHQTVHFVEKLNEYRESFPNEVQDAQDIAKEALRALAASQGTPNT